MTKARTAAFLVVLVALAGVLAYWAVRPVGGGGDWPDVELLGSSTYAGDGGSYPSTITLPSDGDLRNAASVNAGFQALANRDAYLVRTRVNGVDGGTYYPGAAIGVGGAGLAIVDGGTLAINGGATVTSGSSARYFGTYYLSDAGVVVNGGSVAFSSNPTATGYLNVGSGAVISANGGSTLLVQDAGALTLLGGSVVTSVASTDWAGEYAFNATGGVQLNGVAQFAKTLQPIGTGGVVERLIEGTNADGSYGYNQADVIYVPTLSADRAYSITTTGATVGARLRVRRPSISDTYTLYVRKSGTGTNIAEMGDGAAQYQHWLDLVYLGGEWIIDSGEH